MRAACARHGTRPRGASALTRLGGWLAGFGLALAASSASAARREAVIVVSPHPDDESILAADSIHNLASDRRVLVWAIYLSGGDGATIPGDCNGLPEAQKIRRIVKLRERETRRAWEVLAPGRTVPLRFLRGPDQRLVASSMLVDGVRSDTFSSAGDAVIERTLRRIRRLPRSIERAWLLTASRFDAHGDHRAAYHAARLGAEALAARGVEVRLWSFIVHDEIAAEVPICCVGDVHWPIAGPHHDHARLTDSATRPRPPAWTLQKPVANHTLRRAALQRHVSQVAGNPALCMPVFFPDYYERWMEKVDEPFYEEVFAP